MTVVVMIDELVEQVMRQVGAVVDHDAEGEICMARDSLRSPFLQLQRYRFRSGKPNRCSVSISSARRSPRQEQAWVSRQWPPSEHRL